MERIKSTTGKRWQTPLFIFPPIPINCWSSPPTQWLVFFWSQLMEARMPQHWMLCSPRVGTRALLSGAAYQSSPKKWDSPKPSCKTQTSWQLLRDVTAIKMRPFWSYSPLHRVLLYGNIQVGTQLGLGIMAHEIKDLFSSSMRPSHLDHKDIKR